jgi:hypothetical protein
MEFLTQDFLATPVWMWLGFLAIIAVLLTLDLGVLHHKPHEIRVRESLFMSAGYLSLGLAFGGWVWFSLGQQAGLEYLTGFVADLLGWQKFPPAASLGITFAILTTGIAWSLWRTRTPLAATSTETV